MRILLPPSEGKAARGRGRSLAARGLEGPLAVARRAVLEAVAAWCADDPVAAAAGLGLPATTVAHDLAVNVHALRAPTMPAVERFRGVVYDGLAIETMDRDERRVTNRTLLISSGGFGLLAAAEPIPDHRVPMSAILPGIGGLTPFWRRRLEHILPELGRQLVIDLRSTDYLAAPPVPAAARRHVLAVRILTEREDGTRIVVSYASKLTKGRLARALVAAEAQGQRLVKPEHVARVAAAAGFRVESGLTTHGQPTLDVIV